MKVLRYPGPRQAEIIEVDTPEPSGNEVLSKSLYCNISAGTEMGFYRGTAPQLNNDIEPGWFFKEKPGNITYPMQSNDKGVWWMGYANVSQVVKTGPEVKNLKEGDYIFAQTTHKEYQLLPEDAVNKLPEGINLEHASLTALIEITFNGILDAGLRLKDRVAVFGLGTLGQLLVQMAKRSGARVLAVDGLQNRLHLAKKCGADQVIDFTNTDAAKQIYQETSEKGADIVFEVSGNINALTDAMRAVAYNGKVTVLSFYQEPAAPVQLGNEFHHKRITLQSSQILGINPALSNTWDMARRRQSAIELVSELNIEPLISHRFNFDDAPEALKIIDQDPSKCNAVTLKY